MRHENDTQRFTQYGKVGFDIKRANEDFTMKS